MRHQRCSWGPYHFHFLTPLAMALLQTLDQLFVTTYSHTIALGKRRREFRQSARVNCPSVFGPFVLHPNVPFVGNAMNSAHFPNKLFKIIIKILKKNNPIKKKNILKITSAILKFHPPCPSCICLKTSRLTSTRTLSPTENNWWLATGAVEADGPSWVDLWLTCWEPVILLGVEFSLLILRLLWWEWGGGGGGGREDTVVGHGTATSRPFADSSLLINSECCLGGWLQQLGVAGVVDDDGVSDCVWVWFEPEEESTVWPFDQFFKLLVSRCFRLRLKNRT